MVNRPVPLAPRGGARNSASSLTGAGPAAVEFDPLKTRDPGRGLPHAPSYWAATAGPEPPDDGPLSGDIEVEVAVIGGGYAGLSCAWHLARAGISVAVLEANRFGWGCSGRNGSFARWSLGRMGYADWVDRWGADIARALFAEAAAGQATVRELIREGGIDCDVVEGGYLKLAHRESRIATLERELAVIRDVYGANVELLDAETIAERHFRGTEAHAALRFSDAIGLHPLKYVQGLLAMARSAGAVAHSASPVTGVRKDGDARIVDTTQGRVRAKQVALAVNGYGPEMHAATRGRILPVLSDIIVTCPMSAAEKAEANLVTDHMMSDTRELLNYFRRLRDDRIMLGSRGPLRPTKSALDAHRAELLATIRRKFPALSGITADYFWGGWVAITLDSMPHVASPEDDPCLHYAMGFNGTGVSAATQAGRRMAERIMGQDNVHPALSGPIPRMPFAAFRRLGQAAMFRWLRWRDERD